MPCQTEQTLTVGIASGEKALVLPLAMNLPPRFTDGWGYSRLARFTRALDPRVGLSSR